MITVLALALGGPGWRQALWGPTRAAGAPVGPCGWQRHRFEYTWAGPVMTIGVVVLGTVLLSMVERRSVAACAPTPSLP